MLAVSTSQSASAEPVAKVLELVDLELVLAVDASGSVDDAEFELQRAGIASAFRDQGVVDAIRAGPRGRIAVTLMVWAEHNLPKDFSPWVVIDGADSAARFADIVSTFPRRVRGSTGIGRAVQFAVRAIGENDYRGDRLVIDVSGDGAETAPRDFTVLAPQAKAIARAAGVVVNGLAILSDEPDLLTYYEREVIAGTGAFAMAATGFDSFAEAMREKLLREISYRPIVSQGCGLRSMCEPIEITSARVSSAPQRPRRRLRADRPVRPLAPRRGTGRGRDAQRSGAAAAG